MTYSIYELLSLNGSLQADATRKKKKTVQVPNSYICIAD